MKRQNKEKKKKKNAAKPYLHTEYVPLPGFWRVSAVGLAHCFFAFDFSGGPCSGPAQASDWP